MGRNSKVVCDLCGAEIRSDHLQRHRGGRTCHPKTPYHVPQPEQPIEGKDHCFECRKNFLHIGQHYRVFHGWVSVPQTTIQEMEALKTILRELKAPSTSSKRSVTVLKQWRRHVTSPYYPVDWRP